LAHRRMMLPVLGGISGWYNMRCNICASLVKTALFDQALSGGD
jgi:hypothetical protein